MEKFKNSPIHNKEGILKELDLLTPSEMIKVVELLNKLKVIRKDEKINSLPKEDKEL